MKKRNFFAILCLLLLAVTIALNGCGKGEREYFTSLSELNGKTIGVLTGTIFDTALEKRLPEAKKKYYNSYSDQAVAVANGQLDGFLTDEPLARDLMNEVKGITMLDEYLDECEYAFVFAKSQEGDLLRQQFNQYLARIKADGTLQEIDEIWFGTDESRKTVDLPSTGLNGKLVMSTNSTTKPFVYLKNVNQIVGYDIDIAARFCREYGYALEIIDTSFDTTITNVIIGMSDMAAGCITVTEERKESVNFSDANYSGGLVMMVAETGSAESGGFFASIADSFEKTFIRENRWQLILRGVGVTLLLSIGSAIAGTLLGFGVCMLKRSKNRVASAIATIYIRVIQGLPVMVLLMLLYYVIFGTAGVDAILVAIIGFSLNFAAYVSEMMRTGIEAVDAGQTEAARALGFNRAKTFGKVVLPQAAKHFMPVYTGEFISMVKMTSVVGYITIQDLTKVGDIIRSATYESFFPLIAVALIYFLLAYALTFLLKLLMRKVLPSHKKRQIKGVAL